MSTAWPKFLNQLLTASLTAAAGSAANAATTAATASPIVGAAADAAARKATDQLLGQFLPAQQEALQRIEGMTREIYALVDGLDARVKAHQSGPGRAALLHMEDAARHPEHAVEELQTARRLLYEAWGAASDASQRSFAAQQLSAVYALLGNHEDSSRWLERSLPDMDLAVEDAILDLCDILPSFPRRLPRGGQRSFMEVNIVGKGTRYAPADRLFPDRRFSKLGMKPWNSECFPWFPGAGCRGPT